MLRERIALTGESGQTMAEYAVVLGVIVLGVVLSLTLFSEVVEAAITATTDLIKSVT